MKKIGRQTLIRRAYRAKRMALRAESKKLLHIELGMVRPPKLSEDELARLTPAQLAGLKEQAATYAKHHGKSRVGR